MMNMSPEAIQSALARLSDRKVNFMLDLASTPHVAKKIIRSLPGVKELSETGPEAEKAVLDLLRDETTLEDENLSAISVYILESYPSERVKLALAKPIIERRFIGLSSQIAAETFLKAAGIDAVSDDDAIKTARREAKKYQAQDSAT